MRIMKTKLSMALPHVGDKITRVMSTGILLQAETFVPKACKVTYVNRAHNWYEVEFLDSGVRESYSLPTFDHGLLAGLNGWATPVVCVETGDVYRTVTDCADDMGLDKGNISNCLVGRWDSYRSYHFDTVL